MFHGPANVEGKGASVSARVDGVLAPNAALREQIVPGSQPQHEADPAGNHQAPAAPRSYRLTWSQLLARVFEHAINCRSPSRGDR